MRVSRSDEVLMVLVILVTVIAAILLFGSPLQPVDWCTDLRPRLCG